MEHLEPVATAPTLDQQRGMSIVVSVTVRRPLHQLIAVWSVRKVVRFSILQDLEIVSLETFDD